MHFYHQKSHIKQYYRVHNNTKDLLEMSNLRLSSIDSDSRGADV